jgi:hypothetical protein
MKPQSLCVKAILASSLALAAPCLWSQDGLKGALSPENLASPVGLAAPFWQTLASADFDGDNKPDGAVLLDSGLPGKNNFRIQFHFTGRRNSEIDFQSPEKALSVAARDINHDGYTDVIIEQPLTHKPVGVWLNDGHGDFHQGRIEDFPAPGLGSHERLESPIRRADFPALCLRTTETGMLTACPRLGHPGSSVDLEATAIDLTPGSRALSSNSPRAPPQSHSH